MKDRLIKLHALILDGDLTEAAELCDELIAEEERNGSDTLPEEEVGYRLSREDF